MGQTSSRIGDREETVEKHTGLSKNGPNPLISSGFCRRRRDRPRHHVAHRPPLLRLALSHMSLRFWTDLACSSDSGTNRGTLLGYLAVYVGQESKLPVFMVCWGEPRNVKELGTVEEMKERTGDSVFNLDFFFLEYVAG
jgi:hypothetical protein